MEKKKIGVLMGGFSNEREVSLETGRAISEALREMDHDVVEIDVTSEEVPELEDPSIDLFFVALHGSFGEDGGIQKKLEKKNRPFTGSGSDASRLGMDKIAAKQEFRKQELPTPPYHLYRKEDRPVPPPCGITDQMDAGNGWVVKPRAEGSSIGVQMVKNRNEIPKAVKNARNVSEEVFVEPRYEGPEITVGILEGEALPPIQLEPARSFYDYEAKYEDENTDYNLNPSISSDLQEEVKDLAARCFRVIGCRDFGRVDLIMHENQPYILEINTIPGMTSHSLLPKAAREAGISFPELCDRIAASALCRQESEPAASRKPS